MAKKYLKQYRVPSRSDPLKSYKVSVTDKGNWECDCPAWKFRSPRRDCHHIEAVKANPDVFEEPGALSPEDIYPKIVLANVLEVTKKENNELYVPLIPIGGAFSLGFTATVIYDLLKYGVPWGEVKEKYGKLLKRMDGSPARKKDVIDFINSHGRTVLKEHGDGWRPSVYIKSWEGLNLK